MFCGPGDVVYLELSVMDREGRQTPFAWQECRVDCQSGGSCSVKDPLYIDITGDARPEVKIKRLGDVVKVKRSFLRNPRFNFTEDILPSWLQRELGPKLKMLSTIGPGDSVTHVVTAKSNPFSDSAASTVAMGEVPVVPEASPLLLLGGAVSGLAAYMGLQFRSRRRS